MYTSLNSPWVNLPLSKHCIRPILRKNVIIIRGTVLLLRIIKITMVTIDTIRMLIVGKFPRKIPQHSYVTIPGGLPSFGK